MPIKRSRRGSWRRQEGPLDHGPHLTHVKEMGGKQGWAGRGLDCSRAPRTSWTGWAFESSLQVEESCVLQEWACISTWLCMVTVKEKPMGKRLWSQGIGGFRGQKREPSGKLLPLKGHLGSTFSRSPKSGIQGLWEAWEPSFSLKVSFCFFCPLFFLLSPNRLLLLFHATHKPGFHWMGQTAKGSSSSFRER